tara:strand:+ start:3234 stop:4964 length:1731 start_codon:yes stop_codon:yes gene_type:complete
MDEKTLAQYSHLFDQVEKFMVGKEEKDLRKSWNASQKKTWILREPNCPICDQKLTVGTISREHIFPLVLGGRESDDNIIPLCDPCNKNRNTLMTECVGSNKLATLRKRWPANKTSIEEFLVWCHATISQDLEAIKQFPHLNETFSKLRTIDNKYSQKTLEPRKSFFNRGKEWLQNRRNKASKIPKKEEKVRITCIKKECGETFTIPSSYDGKFECPHCGLEGDYSLGELTFEPQTEAISITPKQLRESSSKRTEPVLKEEEPQKDPFNLEEWLSKNWKGLDMAPSTYVELKLAISKHEKINQKRNIRLVLEEDCNLSKNLTLNKMYMRLDEIHKNGKNFNVNERKEKAQNISEHAKYQTIPNLNSSSKGLRFPKEPKDFATSLQWFIDNHNSFQTYKECVDSLKQAEIITKSRVSTTLKPILRGFSSDGSFEAISEQVIKKNTAGIFKRIFEDLHTRTAHVEYITEKEEFMEEVQKYLHAASLSFSLNQVKAEEEWDFKAVIVELIRAGASDSQKLGMEIIQYQIANNWVETGKQAFNQKAEISKSKSYISTIRETMDDIVEIKGDGPAYRFTLRK